MPRLETLSSFCKTSLQSTSFFDNKQACHPSYSKSESRTTGRASLNQGISTHVCWGESEVIFNLGNVRIHDVWGVGFFFLKNDKKNGKNDKNKKRKKRNCFMPVIRQIKFRKKQYEKWRFENWFPKYSLGNISMV